MARSGDIQLLKSTDILSTSVNIINSNFKNLKDSIDSDNNGIAGIDKKFQQELVDIENRLNNNVISSINNRLDNIESQIKELENKIKAINKILDELDGSDPS